MDRRALAEHGLEPRGIGGGDRTGVECAQPVPELQRSEERRRDGHLLVEREADQERERIAAMQRVRLCVVREVQRLGHVCECRAHASPSAMRSATAAVVRLVFARGIVGMTEASATTRPSTPSTRPCGVEDSADRAGAGGVEVVPDVASDVSLEVVLDRGGARSRAASRAAPRRRSPRELDAFDEHLDVVVLLQEARARRAADRSGRSSAGGRVQPSAASCGRRG